MSNKTVKVSEKNYDKIMDIRDLQGLNSADEVLSKILPEGISNNEVDFEVERPAFLIGGKAITWNDLRFANIGNSWSCDDEKATVLFKDDYGILIRFNIADEFFVNYYHFI